MADDKKMDVTPSDEVPAEATARPVIVGHGPILKDPMVTKAEAAGGKPAKTADAPSKSKALQPSDEATAAAAEKSDSPASSTEAEVNAVAEQANTNQKAVAAKQQEEEQKRLDALEKIVQDKTYFVPIGQVNRRRNNRRAVVILVLVVLVALVGLDLVMDAGYLDLPVKPPTNFFQNN